MLRIFSKCSGIIYMLRILPIHKCCVSFQVKDTLFRFKIHLHVKDTPFVGFFWIKDTLNTFWVLSMLRILSLYKFCVSFQVKDTLNKFWGLFMARILPVYTSFLFLFRLRIPCTSSGFWKWNFETEVAATEVRTPTLSEERPPFWGEEGLLIRLEQFIFNWISLFLLLCRYFFNSILDLIFVWCKNVDQS